MFRSLSGAVGHLAKFPTSPPDSTRFACLRPASASSTSSPPPSATGRATMPDVGGVPRLPGMARSTFPQRRSRSGSGRSVGAVTALQISGFQRLLVGYVILGASWDRGLRGIVIRGLQRGLCRLALTGFRILFRALETIAHPLAHLWFVTQLHSCRQSRAAENVPKPPACGGVARAPHPRHACSVQQSERNFMRRRWRAMAPASHKPKSIPALRIR